MPQPARLEHVRPQQHLRARGDQLRQVLPREPLLLERAQVGLAIDALAAERQLGRLLDDAVHVHARQQHAQAEERRLVQRLRAIEQSRLALDQHAQVGARQRPFKRHQPAH
eukprot:CAMPEP_0119168144 /NCGR_PEP_ID=MMETSP1315-20130426/7023_1 /TAXON_ID=676789 /ORGANISM="Prasinoderma singularis, Strain RCC927" /LENGTH=110 /DNA_ID=CAMNT_0007161629 /DNA_START=331 /DNA_END=660 /DNA_ORIENTATION=+